MLSRKCKHVHMNGARIPTATLRRDLANILIRVHAGEIIEITHYERPTAVLVSPDWYARAAKALAAAEAGD